MNEERIIETMDGLDLEQTHELLGDSAVSDSKVSKRSRERIKNATFARIAGAPRIEPTPKRRANPILLRALPAFAALLLVVGGGIWGLYLIANVDAPVHHLGIDATTADTSPTNPTNPQTPPDSPVPGYVWLVEPTFEFVGFGGIHYCRGCDFFLGVHHYHNEGIEHPGHCELPEDEKNTVEMILCERTGEPTGEYHDPNCLGGPPLGDWLYDPNLDLFGYVLYDTELLTVLHPRSEFAEHFPDDIDTIKRVRRIDSTYNPLWQPHTVTTAVAFGNEFVTDFVFFQHNASYGRPQKTVITVTYEEQEGMYIVYKDGTILVSLGDWAWGLRLISENTAFVPDGNGKWGIIGFNAYATATPPDSPATEYVWLIEPTLEHGINYCRDNDAYFMFAVDQNRIIDERTGLVTDSVLDSGLFTSGMVRNWLYDPIEGVFGWVAWRGNEALTEFHSPSEFAALFPEAFSGITAFTWADSVALLASECPARTCGGDSRYDGTAVAYNGEFFTDFDFGHTSGRRSSEIIAIERMYDALSGVIDRSFNVIVPFEFDEILLICENTAFAQVGDLWGIIGWGDYATEQQPPDSPTAEYVWLIEPTLEYQGLRLCSCDRFTAGLSDGREGTVDERTGEVTEDECAHGGGRSRWLYDRALGLLGNVYSSCSGQEFFLESVSEFAQRFPYTMPPLLAVYSFDSTLSETTEHDVQLLLDAHFSEVALMYNLEFVTDFVFSGIGGGRRTAIIYDDEYNWHAEHFDIISLIQGNRHGVVNKRGEVIIPFEFDEILLICENTAFARVGDLWGIIGWGD
jgi:hypothetical protein